MTTPSFLRIDSRGFVRIGVMCALAAGLQAHGQAARWVQLRQQAMQDEDQGNFAAAVPLEQQAAQVAEATWGANDLRLAVTLNALGRDDQHVEKFSDAETNLKRALGIFTSLEGAQGKDVATALNNLGVLYQDLARYADAEKVAQQALAIEVKQLGESDPIVATAESNLALIYVREEKYGDAEALYKKALATDERAGDPVRTAADLAGLGNLYIQVGKDEQAEQAAQQELAALVKAYGSQDPRVASALNDLGVDLTLDGKFADAEQAFGKALTLEVRAPSPDLALTATIEENAGAVFRKEGKYPQAEALLLQALASRAKALGPNHPDVASVLTNLGQLYDHEMRFSDAERALRQALDIDAKALGTGSAQTARDMRDLGNLYGSHGEPGPAEQLYYNAIQIYLKVPGLSPAAVADMVYAGAQQFLADGKLDIAAKLFFDAGGMYHNAEGDSSLGAARCMAQLGAIAEDQGKHDDAENFLKRALGVYEKVPDPNSFDPIDALGGLARIYKGEKRFAEAEPLYLQALKIGQAHLQSNDPVIRALQSDLAALYFAWGKATQAAPYFQTYLGNLMDEFRANAATMSERERLNYFATQKLDFPLFFNFAVKYHDQMPELAGQMYDDLLEEKGLIASSSASMRAAVEASGDPQAVQMLDKMSSDRAQVAALLELSTADQASHKDQINQLGDEANTLEQTLMKRSAAMSQQRAQNAATWRDVQKALKLGESAVEVVRFPYDEGFGPTADLVYAALVVTPDSKEPVIVNLGKAKDLEAGPMMAYRDDVGQTRGFEEQAAPAAAGQQGTVANTGAAYAAFWKPLEPALGGAKRVYVSPDGVLTTIPMGLMADSDGKLLMEKIQLRVVNSTKDLLLPARAAQTKNALVVGNPKFDLTADQQKTAMAELRGGATGAGAPSAGQNAAPAEKVSNAGAAQFASRGGDLKGGDLNPLPGTQVEVDTVEKELKSAGWQATEYTGDLALKDAVTQAHAPRVVHIATHGFFLSDEELKANAAAQGQEANLNEDPMLRAGLFFAGADRVRQGAAPEAGVDDGVLTAYEASQLNLEGTELVVLSACETGLGKELNVDGVFGLRRGLQEAGADSLLMSMWSVPDKETQELMGLFYKNWMSGMEKPEALRQAQLAERETVKQRYGKDLPFYWGAFVFIGR
jgi:CHAT domain-containing protein/Tfp pilus assembly protein PilF